MPGVRLMEASCTRDTLSDSHMRPHVLGSGVASSGFPLKLCWPDLLLTSVMACATGSSVQCLSTKFVAETILVFDGTQYQQTLYVLLCLLSHVVVNIASSSAALIGNALHQHCWPSLLRCVSKWLAKSLEQPQLIQEYQVYDCCAWTVLLFRRCMTNLHIPVTFLGC